MESEFLPGRYVKAKFGGRTMYVLVTTKQPGMLGGTVVRKDGFPVERKVAGGYSRETVFGMLDDFADVRECRMSKQYGELVEVH